MDQSARRLRLTRRQVLQGAASAGLLAGCGRLPWQAEPGTVRVPTLGYLTDVGSRGYEVFREGLREFGYVDGQNVLIEYRDADGSPERLSGYVAELVRMPVTVIVAGSGNEARAAMQATRTIPVVMGIAPDPIAQGLVESLARPGGNVTGPSYMNAQLTGKRLELLKETVPGLSRVAMLGVRQSDILGVSYGVPGTAAALGIQLLPVEVDDAEQLPGAFSTALQLGADGIHIAPNPMLSSNASWIVEAAAASRLPAIYENGRYVRAGGLMAYGPNTNAVRRRAAYYVDRILKGAKPADLPIEQPMTFDFILSPRTAKALGLTIPYHILFQATEVIE